MSQPSVGAPEKASAPSNPNAAPNDKADLGGHNTLANPDTQQTNPSPNDRPKRKTVPTVRGELDGE